MPLLSNVLAPERLVKQVAESRVYAMDFEHYPEVLAGQTLTGTPTVSVAPSGLTVAAPSISGSQVRFRVSGGTLEAGTTERTFRFEVLVATSGGDTLEGDGILYLTD